MTTRRGFLAWIAGTVASARATAQTTAPADLDGGVAPDLFSGAPAPDDPLEFLYSRRLAFDGGQPLITVRVAEGRREALLLPRGALQADARSASGAPQPAVSDGAEGRWSVRLVDASAGVGAAWVELEEIRYGDREGLARAREGWDSRGVKTRITTVGQVYGIAGHVVDTRKYAVLAEGDATEAGARAQAAELTAQFEGVRPQILREMASRPSGRIELLDPEGKVRAVGEGAIELRARGGITVPDVEFGMGYAFHGHEARTYPGPLYAAVDAAGTLALVAGVPMERLVKGVVPSEIFANAHAEALKAQAVTARGEVLAKIGARHLGDPYLLCAEQHCQVYRGSSAETAGTDRAVDDTRGEALFARVPARGVLGEKAKGRVSRLVDSVYSAVCGGFTENNDAVWARPIRRSAVGPISTRALRRWPVSRMESGQRSFRASSTSRRCRATARSPGSPAPKRCDGSAPSRRPKWTICALRSRWGRSVPWRSRAVASRAGRGRFASKDRPGSRGSSPSWPSGNCFAT